MRVTPNVECETGPNAYATLDILMEAYNNKLPPYDKPPATKDVKPQSMFPGGEHYLEKEHAMFFLQACSYMQATVSESALRGLTKLFETHPKLFDSDHLQHLEVGELAETLKGTIGHGRQNEVAKRWITNSKKLHEEYDDDPRNILLGATRYDECFKRLANDKEGGGFRGFGHKMVSMYLYFFSDEGLIAEDDMLHAATFSPPVDIHVMRVALANELIKLNMPDGFNSAHRGGRGDSVFEHKIRELLCSYIADRNVSPLDLTNALWMLSSEYCSITPGNKSRKFETDEGLVFEFKQPQLDSLTQSEAWFKSCGKCALNAAETCSFYMPSTPYFKSGAITLLPKGGISNGDWVRQTSIDSLLDEHAHTIDL